MTGKELIKLLEKLEHEHNAPLLTYPITFMDYEGDLEDIGRIEWDNENECIVLVSE
jgi:hypothetical protein